MDIKALFKNQISKNILSVLAIPLFGYILLNVTFVFDWFFQSCIREIINLFTPVNWFRQYSFFPPILHALFVLLIGFFSWLIFKSKLAVIYKAIYMTVPLAVMYVTLGISFYRWPIIAYSLGFLASLAILYYFHRTRQPWLYYYTLILVAVTLTIFHLSGGEI